MSKYSNSYWTAFYTKPRNEKKVAERLASKGFEVYCPMRTVLKQWSDRKKKVKEPVFNSYIFAKVHETSRASILLDHGIVSNVFWLGQPAKIRDVEIKRIQAFLEEYQEAEVRFSNLKAGDEVLVDSGPFSGINGAIYRVKGNRAYLSITSLGIEIHAEIGLNRLKRLV